ncbi:hypothetical protein QQS21_011139 [Conoideocrella luteorostrata]|uniref:Early meiotic induction protein 1 n=1 Tax=Conoideocrella luteorostrata TaxID=1105319 RepID=A0AAJ0CFZ8_9HYPO|nr:hypothetical protein QQS21_011139 [Conoideocrella luteorostrata]
MGWLWSSSSSFPPKDKKQPPPPPPPTEQASAPNEPVDPEIQKFFDLFKPDAEQPSKPQPPARSGSASSSSSSSSPITSWLSLKAKSENPEIPDAPIGDALSESLLPTDMSCRQAFDLAWGCNGLGGQFNSVYRYGNMRSCSEHWDDFWFCMRTRSYTGDVKANMVRTHYRNKAYRKYGEGNPSSEDIWESRKEKAPPGSAFNMPVGEANVGDEEWRRMEEERRRNIRDKLGYQS